MNDPPIVERLWDYGWLSRDVVQLPAATSDLQLIRQYVVSPSFHTSFLPSDKDETGIHGPFYAGRIGAEDYIPLCKADLERYLASVELSETPDEDETERAKIWLHLGTVFARGYKCYVLRRDERNNDLFHDWGFVLIVFREFLFVDPLHGNLERFVIGYD